MSDDDDDDKPAAPMPNIPVSWSVNGQKIAGAKSLIKQPTEGEVNTFSNQRVRVCPDCKFFQKDEKTDRKIKESGLARKLEHEFKWKPEYMPGKVRELGICRQKNDTVVGPHSKACEYYKVK
jgi:hypothetical protein